MELPAEPTPIEIGRGEVLAAGERVALVGYGNGVQIGLSAAHMLKEHGIAPTVCDARFAKPLDADLLSSLAADHELLVTIEENVLAGGFGSAVLEHLSDSASVRGTLPHIVRFGVPDRYVTHGSPDLLRAEVGLTPERVTAAVIEAMDRPRALRSA